MKLFSRDIKNGYTNFLFNLLPQYFRDNDTYPISVGGYTSTFLERFYEIFCNELDDNLNPPVTSIPELFNYSYPEHFTEQQRTAFIEYTADLWLIRNIRWKANKETYINIIRNYRYIAEVRGTKKALELYLFLQGYEISELEELEILYNYYDYPVLTPLKYDDNHIYDMSNPVFYTEYNLEILAMGNTPPLTEIELNQLKHIINYYFNPAYTKLINLTENTL